MPVCPAIEAPEAAARAVRSGTAANVAFGCAGSAGSRLASPVVELALADFPAWRLSACVAPSGRSGPVANTGPPGARNVAFAGDCGGSAAPEAGTGVARAPFPGGDPPVAAVVGAAAEDGSGAVGALDAVCVGAAGACPVDCANLPKAFEPGSDDELAALRLCGVDGPAGSVAGRAGAACTGALAALSACSVTASDPFVGDRTNEAAAFPAGADDRDVFPAGCADDDDAFPVGWADAPDATPAGGFGGFVVFDPGCTAGFPDGANGSRGLAVVSPV